MSKTKVLITRPQQQGRELANKLTEQGITALSQPLFDYQTRPVMPQIQQLFSSIPAKIVIFVSVAAVHHANIIWPLVNWTNCKILAVGAATREALAALTEVEILCPEQQNSEGLLALPALAQVRDQQIIIVRGNGGRELLKKSLLQRGAKVHYIESYQRVWHAFSPDIGAHWQTAQINCIVITSQAILQRINQLIVPFDGYWKNTCLWIVASARIADSAKALGLQHVVNAGGANDKAIVNAIANQPMG